MTLLFQGTEAEFERIVSDHKLLLYSVVYAIAGSADADDIVQETFIHAYYNWGTIRDPGRATAWLCSVARNKAYDAIRKRRRTISIDELGERATHVTPESLYIRHEERDRLMDEIAALSEKVRETVMLHYFADKSIREISEILEIPQGTVKFRLSEGRKKLRKELMDRMNEEKKTVSEKNIFEQIKEATTCAWDAIQTHNTGLASDICDGLINQIDGDLSKLSREEMEILSGFYSAKARSLKYTELRAALPFIEKQVEIAEASGDMEWLSESYSYYATELSNAGEREKSVEYYKKSLEIAEQTGKASLIADRLYWNGIRAFECKEEDSGLPYFERILSMKDELLGDRENDSQSKEAYCLAYSAAIALRGIGNRMDRLDGFQSCVPCMAKGEDGWGLQGEPGYSSSDECELAEVFYRITRLSPCLSHKVCEGYAFKQDTFSYSPTPVRSKYEVISMDEALSVPAGEFAHCIHTRYTNDLGDDDNRTNRFTNGVTDIWYAESVGVVCVRFVPVEGGGYTQKLSSYTVNAPENAIFPDSYLPMAVGNTWVYESYDKDGVPFAERFDYENRFEVVCFRDCDGAAMIANSAWSVRK
ncbi:MAG: RNA polymerase sigma factor [Clostridia bacterium]|nr:RNA polymerase sigma factor [Clostridia bacterium]